MRELEENVALNGYGKPLQKKNSTIQYSIYGDQPHCSAFCGENVKAAEQFTVAQLECKVKCDVVTSNCIITVDWATYGINQRKQSQRWSAS